VAGLSVTLVEVDAALAALARDNAVRNGLGERVKVAVLDVAAPDAFTAAGLLPESIARVLMNPPFNDSRNVSPDAGRRLAHVGSPGMLAQWMRRAAALLAPSGMLTLIWRADGLADVLSASTGFGGLAVRPVYPRPDAAAIRVLVRAIKGSRAPLALLPGLTLNDAEGRPGVEAEAILRGGAAIPFPA
jgi:tRNA1(Val) A37 N6-methylase TrmN6